MTFYKNPQIFSFSYSKVFTLCILALGLAISMASKAFSQVSLTSLPKDERYIEHVNEQSTRSGFAFYDGAKDTYRLRLPANIAKQVALSIDAGDLTKNAIGGFSHTQTIYIGKHAYVLSHTQGKLTAIGELKGNGEHWYYVADTKKTVSTNINALNLLSPTYEFDTHGIARLATQTRNKSAASAIVQDVVEGHTIVDLMLLYTPNIQAEYPGEMANTLLEHLVATTNQAFVNSDVRVQLRLVRSEFVNYVKPSSITALTDLRNATQNNGVANSEPSLNNVNRWRNEVGADMVAMIRTHDLNEREVCGIAMFPDDESDTLVNVSNVGISGGSNCINTFTHEVGHNFGAGHQAVNGQSVGALNNSGALLIREKFNTIMSSIGTGDENRNFKLTVFSNLDNNCGGRICGDSEFADNASTIEAFAAQNASLREQIVPITNFSLPIKTLPDTDGDDVRDDQDAFPFVITETLDTDNDGVGDNLDAFPNNRFETLDTDGDGIGNNQDNDDDNDNVVDALDVLPLNAQESVDNDADGFGANQDALENDFREYLDVDNDGIGDKRDLDDDNDGVNDFTTASSLSDATIVVMSADSSQALEYDATTGEFIGELFAMPSGSITFRSDLKVSSFGELFFIAFSDVYSYDRQQSVISKVIDRDELQTNFPAHLAFRSTDVLAVNNGLGNSHVEGFSFTANGKNAIFTQSSNDTYRDFEFISTNEALIATRNQSQIQALNVQTGGIRTVATTSINEPEYIARDQSNNIYVANGGNNTVVKLTSTGGFIGVIITANENGLGKISCLEVGPDQHLYVCSQTTNEVFKFTLDGDFVEILISAGAGGLNKPVSLAFIGKPLDQAPLDPNNDSDNDGTVNINDDLPLNANETVDTDADGIGNNTDTDDDNDGMTDTFEIQFNFDPLNPADANQDADNDGRSNVAEFTGGTDPRVANDFEPEPEPDNGGGGGSLPLSLSLLLFFMTVRKYVQVNPQKE
jgi:hypothetical protein